MKTDNKGLPEDTRSETENDIKLRGTTICPGIGIGQARLLDREFFVPRNEIDASQVQSEQQRYSKAVKIVTEHLREHIEEAHAGSSLSSSLILKNHEAMLTDEQFHKAVLLRISAEYKNAAWALEVEGEKIITGLEASRSPYLISRAEDIRDLVASIVDTLSPTRRRTKSFTAEWGIGSAYLRQSFPIFGNVCPPFSLYCICHSERCPLIPCSNPTSRFWHPGHRWPERTQKICRRWGYRDC